MKIGLIDVDSHNFPNLPLMKLSAWHKAQGDTVEWWWGFGEYDRVYMSKVFDETYSPDIPEPLNAREIIKGGTGYGLDNYLPDDVEHIYPDYSLYSGRDERRQLTDAELVDRMEAMLGGIMPKFAILDPSASSMKAALQRRGYHVWDADNDVLDGISDVATMLHDGQLGFMGCCKNTIAEFGSYFWDEKAADAGIDAPLKADDHAMDATRYFVKTMRLVQKNNKKQRKSIFDGDLR